MIDRRLFLQGLSATAIAASLTPETSARKASQAESEAARQIAPSTDSSPLRVGIIGPGSRGKELVRNLLRVPGVRIVAAADVYPPRFDQLNQVLRLHRPITHGLSGTSGSQRPRRHHCRHTPRPARQPRRPRTPKRPPRLRRKNHGVHRRPGSRHRRRREGHQPHLPGRPPVPLQPMDPRRHCPRPVRRDRRGHPHPRLLEPQQRLAPSSPYPGPGRTFRAPHQLASL